MKISTFLSELKLSKVAKIELDAVLALPEVSAILNREEAVTLDDPKNNLRIDIDNVIARTDEVMRLVIDKLRLWRNYAGGKPASAGSFFAIHSRYYKNRGGSSLRLLRERDRKPKFGLVWERNEIEHDKSLNDAKSERTEAWRSAPNASFERTPSAALPAAPHLCGSCQPQSRLSSHYPALRG